MLKKYCLTLLVLSILAVNLTGSVSAAGIVTRVTGISGPSFFEIMDLASYDGSLYFGADGSDFAGQELWKYDGINFSRAADIYSGSSDSDPRYMTVFEGELYFSADGGDGAGRELWKYDGTSASRAFDIDPGSHESYPSGLTVYNGALYFAAYEMDGTGWELWKYDGSSASLVADIFPGNGNSSPTDLTVYNGALYFGANGNDGAGHELWKFDGTNVSRVADISPGANDGFYCSSSSAVVYNGVLYFCANDGDGNEGNELWQYNGSVASLALDIRPGSDGSNPSYAAVFDGELYFQANGDDTAFTELRKFDGASASLAADINPSGSSQPFDLTVYNEELFFVADDGATGSQMWKYAPDTIPPEVNSILRANANPTNASSVDFTVTFSEAVTGVSTSDFSLTTDGTLTGTSVTGVSGSGTTYTVTVSIGAGLGTLRLDIPNTATIIDTAGNLLSSLPYENGEAYTVLFKIFLPSILRDTP